LDRYITEDDIFHAFASVMAFIASGNRFQECRSLEDFVHPRSGL
jgi:hypothetical protein